VLPVWVGDGLSGFAHGGCARRRGVCRIHKGENAAFALAVMPGGGRVDARARIASMAVAAARAHRVPDALGSVTVRALLSRAT
jgi:hypothetical protein